ncbi:MAG: alpha/beta fold hydrolase [Planctomyces sp.]|nr:alpha/beta fold hydrolase [Planctomyces sp.]
MAWRDGRVQHWLDEERLDRGLAIVLPGVEGRSWWNRRIARGLIDGGAPQAVDIFDWTAGPLLMLYNLRSRKLHREQVARLREKVLTYQAERPGRPVWLLGHSGGGALSLLTLAALPDGVRIAGAVLLCPAISPGFDLRPALAHVERGIWNVSSWGDLLFLGAFTTLFGTVDGRHVPAAGACGFRSTGESVDARSSPAAGPPLIEMPWRPAMARDGNLGGHFGCVRRRFIARWVAPLLQDAGQPASPLAQPPSPDR